MTHSYSSRSVTNSIFIKMLFYEVDNYIETQLNNEHRKKDTGTLSHLKQDIYIMALQARLRDLGEGMNRKLRDRGWYVTSWKHFSYPIGQIYV